MSRLETWIAELSKVVDWGQVSQSNAGFESGLENGFLRRRDKGQSGAEPDGQYRLAPEFPDYILHRRIGLPAGFETRLTFISGANRGVSKAWSAQR